MSYICKYVHLTYKVTRFNLNLWRQIVRELNAAKMVQFYSL